MENFQQLKELSASKCKASFCFFKSYVFGVWVFFVLEVPVSENCLQRELFCHEYGLSPWVLLTFFIYFLLWCCRCSEWIRIQFLMATRKKKKWQLFVLSFLLSEVHVGSCALNNIYFVLMVVGKGYSFMELWDSWIGSCTGNSICRKLAAIWYSAPLFCESYTSLLWVAVHDWPNCAFVSDCCACVLTCSREGVWILSFPVCGKCFIHYTTQKWRC